MPCEARPTAKPRARQSATPRAFISGVTWADYGFQAGQSFTIAGAGANNGTYTVASVNGGKLEITTDFGSAGTLAILVSIGLIFMLPKSSFRKATRLALALGLVIMAAALPSQNRLWAALHGTSVDHIIVTEDSTNSIPVLVNDSDPDGDPLTAEDVRANAARYGGDPSFVVAAGESAARSGLKNADEIGDLGRAFDKLLDERIAQLEEAGVQFVQAGR